MRPLYFLYGKGQTPFPTVKLASTQVPRRRNGPGCFVVRLLGAPVHRCWDSVEKTMKFYDLTFYRKTRN